MDINNDNSIFSTFATKEDNKKTLNLDDLKEIVNKLKEMPEPEWLAISPDGVMYKGTVNQLLPILAKDTSLKKYK